MLGQIWYSLQSESINLLRLPKLLSSLHVPFALIIILTNVILHQKAEKVQK